MSDLTQFRQAYQRIEKEGYNWQELDGVLYGMCAAMPDHTDKRQVIAKVGLINRGYRANLQMGTDEAEWKLALALVDSDIDTHLNELRGFKTFDAETAPATMAAHATLVALCQEATSRGAVSFASKYLAFHVRNVVPVFDSYAYDASWKLAGEGITEPLIRGPTEPYGWHCAAVLRLADDLRAHGIEPDVKLIDVVLYGLNGGTG